jgi:hypothetical protein
MTAPSTATFSLEEYAQILLGASGRAELEWLSERLCGRAQPRLPGYKAGRRWRATQADIDTAIDLLRPKHIDLPQVPQATSMTRTSQRRLAS